VLWAGVEQFAAGYSLEMKLRWNCFLDAKLMMECVLGACRPPENFLHGHISKAGDVYAYGVLLFEIMTGSRAFAGTPTPLLAHQVAVSKARPRWPEGLADEVLPLRELAEACWAQRARDR
jgi:hypothetical protein